MTIYEKLKSELAQNSNGGSANLIPGIAGKNDYYLSFKYLFLLFFFYASLTPIDKDMIFIILIILIHFSYSYWQI
jgi:hypothetical protein